MQTTSIQITCEFTGGWPMQLTLRRPSNIRKSSTYLGIHRWMAHSAYFQKTLKHQEIFDLPMNSQVDGPCSLPEEDLQTSGNLQFTCEFTGRWLIRLTLRRPSDINESSDYL